jgi:hypothetical protein
MISRADLAEMAIDSSQVPKMKSISIGKCPVFSPSRAAADGTDAG